jgi:hypothetical protein
LKHIDGWTEADQEQFFADQYFADQYVDGEATVGCITQDANSFLRAHDNLAWTGFLAIPV